MSFIGKSTLAIVLVAGIVAGVIIGVNMNQPAAAQGARGTAAIPSS